IGMVPIDAEVGGLYELLGAADAALEMARESAAETHSFDPENSQDLRLAEHYGEMRWLGRIDRALRQEQFCLYRQPIVRSAMPRVAEAPLHEVLIRMVDDDGRIISPGSFIPAAERFQLIASLDRWVVGKALELLGREVARDPKVSVALNVSGQSLGDASFHDFVAAELAASCVDPWRLCFEITETAAVSNLERARRFIMRLRERGCRFILDDFGSGMSSFAYLKNLPVDFLKIDGGFIREMLEDRSQLAIVRAIHQVGRALGLATIAEMVESRAQLDAVSEIGVDYVQGYFLRHPEPWRA
ncbi:MAG: EAL domain-containing protein, partial [Thermoanaerobaculia bacterium]|nr:EAL domain-containing protein [Thermoanaerobaculia bacterium]